MLFTNRSNLQVNRLAAGIPRQNLGIIQILPDEAFIPFVSFKKGRTECVHRDLSVDISNENGRFK